MILLPQTQGHRAHSPDQGLGASAERKTRGQCIEARLHECFWDGDSYTTVTTNSSQVGKVSWPGVA